MRVLVTGGAGFTGSHLCEALVARGDDVVALDDLSAGSRANLASLDASPRFELVVGSASNAELVQGLVSRVDRVLHLAAAVGVRLVVERPVHAITTNVDTARVVLAACARASRPFLLASTSEVYGKSVAAPFREDADVTLGATTRGRWSYACSKALDEWLALAHARESGLEVRIARLFNVVGPRQSSRWGMVLPTFARQALAGDPITVHGDGAQTRCFAHVADVVRMLLALDGCAAALGEVVNVGADEEITVRRLAELVRALSDSRSEIVHVPYEEVFASDFEDMARRVPDLSKLERLIGERPRTALERIVRDVLAAQAVRV